jgi:hypothetical protein
VYVLEYSHKVPGDYENGTREVLSMYSERKERASSMALSKYVEDHKNSDWSM